MARGYTSSTGTSVAISLDNVSKNATVSAVFTWVADNPTTQSLGIGLEGGRGFWTVQSGQSIEYNETQTGSVSFDLAAFVGGTTGGVVVNSFDVSFVFTYPRLSCG